MRKLIILGVFIFVAVVIFFEISPIYNFFMEDFPLQDLLETLEPMVAKVVAFIFISTAFLFWVGLGAGWRFSQRCDFGLELMVLSLGIGVCLSFPIALGQLLTFSRSAE